MVALYTVITLLPLVWIISTSFKTGPDSISYPPKVFFDPTVEGYVNLFTTRTRPAVSELETLPPPEGLMEEIARRQGTITTCPIRFGERFMRSSSASALPRSASSSAPSPPMPSAASRSR